MSNNSIPAALRSQGSFLYGVRRTAPGIVELSANDDGTLPVVLESGGTLTLVDGNGVPIVGGIPITGGVSTGGTGGAVGPAAIVDISGTITAGGTAQNLIGQEAGGHSVTLVNTSSGVLRVNEAGSASATAGDSIPAGASWQSSGYVTNAISVWGATTWQTFRATRSPAPTGATVGTVSDASGTTTGAAQTLVAQETAGHVVVVVNTSASAIRVSDSAQASATVGDAVPAGETWVSTGYPGFITNAVTVFGAAGLTFRAIKVTPVASQPTGATVVVGTVADLSGTIAAGGTAQSLVPQEAGGHAVVVVNTSAGDLRINEVGAASAAVGDKVPAGETWTNAGYPARISNAISIWGATTGQTFRATKV